MRTMKAMQIHRFGAEDVMQLDTDVPVPEPGPREILIKCAATGINHSDLFIRENGNIHIGPGDLPLILGREMAGVVAEIGEAVSEFKPGQRVVALPAPQTRATGLPGGKEYTGCYAEYVLARPQDARLVPDGVDMVTAAATAWSWLTAWYVLEAAKIKAGDRALIHAGGSALGTAAIQLAKHVGATVMTTAGSAAKCARLKELGADVAVNYREEDFADAVPGFTDGRGLDVVVDVIAGDVLVKSLKQLAPGGRLIALGSLSGGSRELPPELPGGRMARRFSITSHLMEHTRSMEKLDEFFALIEAGKLRVIVDKVFPLSEAATAHRYIAERLNFGKVVLTV
jgi:NADPH:quinone reductase-like Zn-dependent oxidoreductase